MLIHEKGIQCWEERSKSYIAALGDTEAENRESHLLDRRTAITPAGLSEKIKELNRRGVLNFCCTAWCPGKYGHMLSVSMWRTEELRRLKYDEAESGKLIWTFPQLQDGKNFQQIVEGNSELKGAEEHDGIGYANWNSKGLFSKKLIETTVQPPRKKWFIIEDEVRNLDKIEDEMKDLAGLDDLELVLILFDWEGNRIEQQQIHEIVIATTALS